jgi:hypothetical protein
VPHHAVNTWGLCLPPPRWATWLDFLWAAAWAALLWSALLLAAHPTCSLGSLPWLACQLVPTSVSSLAVNTWGPHVRWVFLLGGPAGVILGVHLLGMPVGSGLGSIVDFDVVADGRSGRQRRGGVA